MMKARRRLLVFGVALLLLFISLPVMQVHAVGEWASVHIYQKKVGHNSGCTTCTYQLILQNSGTLKPEYQLTGDQTSRTTAYVNFDNACANAGLNSGDAVYYGSLPSVGSKLCKDGVTWEYSTAVTGTETPEVSSLGSAKLIGKVGSKRFDAMSDSEVISIMKAFYNCDFWCVLGIYYQGSSLKNNGTDTYPANHWVMFSGVDDNGVYINDPIYGSARMEDCSSGGTYKIRYIVPIKCSSCSPRTLAGGNPAELNAQDQTNLGGVGIPTSIAQGTSGMSVQFTDASLLSYCSLTEPNLEETLLLNSDLDNLTQTDLEMLEGWKVNVNGNKNESGFIAILRWVVVLVGILITIWALLIYLAFWFDHINSFFYLDALYILTLGKLHICPPNEKPTFSLGKEVKDKTVSHGQILCICITAILFGSMLISGVFYTLVTKLVHLITGFIWG